MATINPVATQGLPAATAAATNQIQAQVNYAQTASARNPTGYDAGTASGGGIVEDAVNGFTSLASLVQKQMKSLEDGISSLYKSSNGKPLDTATILQMNTQMSQCTLMMEQIARMQEKRNQADQAIVRS